VQDDAARGVKPVNSDAHEGIKAAASKVLGATRQRCRVRFQRNTLAHAGKSGPRVVSAFIATDCAQNTGEAASTKWRFAAGQIRPKVPILATLMDHAGRGVPSGMSLLSEHRAKLHSASPMKRLNGEIKSRTDVMGICPNDGSIPRLIGALLPEQNGAWDVQHACRMTLETIAPMDRSALLRVVSQRRRRGGACSR